MKTADIIRQIVQGGASPMGCVLCKVTAVDKDARCCDCEPENEEAPLLGVSLQAVQGGSVGVVVYPRVGSFVIVGYLSGGVTGVVLQSFDVEAVEITISDSTTRVQLDEQGARVQVGDETSMELTGEGVVINGGSFGGLVKVEDLTKRLNLVEQDINNLKTAIKGWTPVPQDGGSALKAGVMTWAGKNLQLTKRGDYENEKVKQ